MQKYLSKFFKQIIPKYYIYIYIYITPAKLWWSLPKLTPYSADILKIEGRHDAKFVIIVGIYNSRF